MSSENSNSPTSLHPSLPSSVFQPSSTQELSDSPSEPLVFGQSRSIFKPECSSNAKKLPPASDLKAQENTSPFGLLIKQLAEQTKSPKSFKVRPDSNVTVAHHEGLESAREKKDQFDVTLLKKQLELARNKIAEMGHELNQQRQAPQLFGQTLTDPSGIHSNYSNFPDPGGISSGSAVSENSWVASDALVPSIDVNGPGDGMSQVPAPSAAPTVLSWNGLSALGPIGPPHAPQPHRPMSFSGRVEPMSGALGQAVSRGSARPGNAWNSYSSSPAIVSPPVTPLPYADGNTLSNHHQARPFGNLLPSFPGEPGNIVSRPGPIVNNPWNVNPSQLNPNAQHYIPPVEPINYRRLLDRSMSCNWKYIVDKIVCNNDQQASIFLQQKLKVSTQEQKYELVEAIISQAYPLMINRFGNFLIQRCFEHGTPEQVIAIANSIRGKTLDLSMDAFGCHVVQKAFDVVPEEYKALMVHELLRRIPETVVHRYACHVWQKLFELRWSESPPQIMKYVNEALKGMWHEVALGETGSLVVQNIFENCLEEDKRPCVEEVLSSIDIVSHGQFGNWCIQHVCEHGAPADKRRAIEHVLQFATEYSTDQFASKVVEKCLKVGGSDFLDRYLEKVCEGRSDRPRMPLIDIAGDQYGNYLIQYILTNAELHQRELVAQHVRKHMVSLRGSKFGSRVAMLCTNPAIQTRPGPPSTAPIPNAPYYAGAGHVHGSFNSRMNFGMGRQDFR